MLDTLLKTTKLTANAFQTKPIDLNLLKNSQQFWKKEYQTLDIKKEFSHFWTELRQQHAEIDQLFETLIETIKPLIGSNKELKKSIKALRDLKERYWHPPFKYYREKIKQQLEIITYFLTMNDDSDRKMLVILSLIETNVCAEGCYFKLKEIIDELNHKISLSSWLSNLRKEIIHRYYSIYYNNLLVHSEVALLTYAQEIGLNVVDDETTYLYLKEDQYSQPLSENEKKAFRDFFFSHYNTRTIIEYITEQLQLKAKQSLEPFQKQIPSLGLVFLSNDFKTIHESLKHLPIGPSTLFTSIEEDYNYFKFKSVKELKKEVVSYLLDKNILKKQSKTLKINEENWEFNIIEGDYYGDYGFILKSSTSFHEEKYPLADFEEKKLYQYVSIEQFQENKAFFTLGQNAFNYFYKKKANFSNCCLTDIDFRALDTDFISKLYATNDDDAYFMGAKLTYKQLIYFYENKKYPTLNNTYLVSITSAQQFFKIITDVIGSDIKEQSSFLARHKAILTANNLYLDILQYLKDEILKNEQDSIKTIKKINEIEGYSVFFLLFTEMPLFFVGLILSGLGLFYYLPLVYFISISVVLAIFAIPLCQVMLEELQDTPDLFNYKSKLNELRKEQMALVALDGKMIGFSNEQEKTVLTTTENKTTSAIAYSANPTSISSHLLKSYSEPIIRGIVEDELFNKPVRAIARCI